MAELECVIFDWGGTLTPWHTIDLGQAWRACGLGEEMADRLVAAEPRGLAVSEGEPAERTIYEVLPLPASAGPAQIAAHDAWW